MQPFRNTSNIFRQHLRPAQHFRKVRKAPKVSFHIEQRSNLFLDAHLYQPGVSSLWPGLGKVIDRRQKPRFDHPFPARVWGVDAEDEPFSLDCVIDNISACGLYLTIPRKIKTLSEISLAVRVLNSEGVTAALRGTVIRRDLQSDGRYGVAVSTGTCTFL
jgi:PilZ domain